uniref:Immunoglobulin-binding protein 1 n=1 Tax=Rhabditophanes sp. KR3021 TaxID=114890 RepID=A0AC35TQD2_9BILA
MEDFITLLDKGETCRVSAQSKLKEYIFKLEDLKQNVEDMDLFSDNESIEEISSNDLELFLVPSVLGRAYEKLQMIGPKDRLLHLNQAKSYFRDYLEQLKAYRIILFQLPWVGSEVEKTATAAIDLNEKLNAADRRERVIKRFNIEKQLGDKMIEIQQECAQSGKSDEIGDRKYALTKLRLYAIKAIGDLDKIEEELRIVEHMLKVQKGEIAEEKPKQLKKFKPFRIVKDELQKKVFGLGYNSVPTLTVDEWYNQMDKKGHFQTITGEESNHEESEDEDENEEQKRQKKIAWDDWKDEHRAGWGNTYNRG